ncbi:MAG: arsenate reductase ArsC [Polyangia bacterium]
MSDPIKVLFVCVHNAARSRMAETLLNAAGAGRLAATSAGFEPHPISPIVTQALAEIGLRPSSTEPQPSVFDLFKQSRRYDYVISVCDGADGERCPVFPGVTERLAWSFPDPNAFTSSDTEKLVRTAEVREAIARRIADWLATLARGGRLS